MSTPTLSVVTGGDGLSALAAVGSDAGVTNQLYYAPAGSGVWITGVTRTGPGAMTQTGLTLGVRYVFQVESSLAGVLSPASNLAWATMAPSATCGQTDALALAVVAWLNDNADDFCVPIAAERRFRLISELEEIPASNTFASVDVFPDSETDERRGIAPVFIASYAIHIFIQQQVGGTPGPEDQCALLTQLRSQILEGIKPLKFNISNAVHPAQNLILAQAKSADKGLYNLARLLELNVYESDTILVFKAAV
jgi:hypothetical protein